MSTITNYTDAEVEEMFSTENDPVQPINLIKLLGRLNEVSYGTLTVASGDTTGTASVGAALNGKPVFAMLNAVDGTKSVVAAVIAAGTLTVTMSAAVSANRTVAYMILGH